MRPAGVRLAHTRLGFLGEQHRPGEAQRFHLVAGFPAYDVSAANKIEEQVSPGGGTQVYGNAPLVSIEEVEFDPRGVVAKRLRSVSSVRGLDLENRRAREGGEQAGIRNALPLAEARNTYPSSGPPGPELRSSVGLEPVVPAPADPLRRAHTTPSLSSARISSREWPSQFS